jgi:hypothetical protein
LFFSAFLSRAILDFCALPPPMAAGGGGRWPSSGSGGAAARVGLGWVVGFGFDYSGVRARGKEDAEEGKKKRRKGRRGRRRV